MVQQKLLMVFVLLYMVNNNPLTVPEITSLFFFLLNLRVPGLFFITHQLFIGVLCYIQCCYLKCLLPFFSFV